jgi:hypothetical protein
MSSKTFILGAGFSADAGFPLVRTLKNDVLSWVETEQHSSATPHLTPNVHGYPQGQFYAGKDAIDPEGSLGFEELLMALRDRLSATNEHDPCHTFRRIMRDGCGRLLWHKQRTLDRLPVAYQNFASWFHEHHLYGQPNAIISFNWDLLAEKILTDARAGWQYTNQSPWVPVLKPHGSINWSDHVEVGLRAESSEWQPIAPQSTYCYLPRAPFSDPFENGLNQRLRKLFLPGDPEDVGGANLIWEEVEVAIRERETVVFIGYSLPQYDAFSTRFFQRVTSGKRIEVYARSAETLQHYVQMLGRISTTEPLAFAQCPYARPFAQTANG